MRTSETISMPDLELIELLKRDPDQGLKQLDQQYRSLVKTIAYSKLAMVYSYEDIEEFINDIFFEFYCSREKIELSKGSIKAMITVMTKNKAITRFHREMRYKNQNVMVEEEQLHRALEHKNDLRKDEIEQQMIKKEEKQQLLKAMEQLDPLEKEIITRKQYLGQTFRMIAYDMEIKQKTVEKRYERALKKLRKILGGGRIGPAR